MGALTSVAPVGRAAQVPTWVSWIALALLTLLGGWLRLRHLGDIPSGVDNVYPYYQVLRTLESGALPIVGQWSSVLFANPALLGYFYWPVILFARTPLAPFVLVTLLNTLAIPLTWRIARPLLSPGAALLATMLVALNPWLIEYSRFTWLQGLNPFGVTLLLALLMPILRARARHPARRLFAALVVLTILSQFYLLNFALLAQIGVLCLCFWRRLPKRALGGGALLFLVVTAAYLGALRYDKDSSLARVEHFSASEEGWRFRRDSAAHALRFATGDDFAYARATTLAPDGVRLRQRLDDTILLLPVLGLLLGALRATRTHSRARREALLVLLLWLAIPMVLLSYAPQPIHPHYLLFTVPAAALLIGYGAEWVARWRVGALLLGVAALAVGGTFVLEVLAHQQSQQQSAGNGEFILPNRIQARIASEIVAQGGKRLRATVDPFLYQSFANQLFPQEPQDPLLDPAGILIARGAPTTYLFYNQPDLPYDGLTELPLAAGNSVQVVTAYPGPATHPLDYPSDGGLRLRGYEVRDLEPGSHARLRLAWEVEQRVDNAFWEPFVHLFDARGERVAVVHGTIAPDFAWEVGDWQWYTLWIDVPPDAVPPLRMEAGLYNPILRSNALLSLPSGQQAPTVPLE